MKTLLLVSVLVVLVWGCASSYMHPTKSAAQFEQDRTECEQIVIQAMAAQGIDNC